MYSGGGSGNETPKRHKKHKKEKDRDEDMKPFVLGGGLDTPTSSLSSSATPARLKLILKVGGGSSGRETPESDVAYGGGTPIQPLTVPPMSLNLNTISQSLHKLNKKAKKKEKKKKKDKKHKHHHKEKKRNKERDGKEKSAAGEYPLIKKLILPIPPASANNSSATTTTIISVPVPTSTIPISTPAAATTTIDQIQSQTLPVPVVDVDAPLTSTQNVQQEITTLDLNSEQLVVETETTPPPTTTTATIVSLPEPEEPMVIEEGGEESIPVSVPLSTTESVEPAIEDKTIINTDENVKDSNPIVAVEPEPIVKKDKKDLFVSAAVIKKNEKHLQKLLDYLLRILEKKDPQEFFRWPVTDKIAPGYTKIVKTPMDFSTIKHKVDNFEYTTVMNFEEDFKLMCGNAILYNHPDTIYYKSAKILYKSGIKCLEPERIKSLLPMIPSIRVLGENQLGFTLISDQLEQEGFTHDILEEDFEAVEKDPQKNVHYMKPHPNDPPDLCGSFADELTTEEVLLQARIAARDAAHRLSIRKPKTNIGFLRVKDDGSTSMSILTPFNGVSPGSKEKPIALGVLSGKLTQGTTQLVGSKEEKKPLRSVKPLYYGAFSSYAPCHDSTFSNLTTEETELLSSTYGDETAIAYAESLIEFAKNSDYAIRMVDEVLNTLTKGEHAKTVNYIEERKRMEEQEMVKKNILEKSWTQDSSLLSKIRGTFNELVDNFSSTAKEDELKKANFENGTSIDYDSLKSLSELGIDTSFVDEMKFFFRSRNILQDKLQETSKLICELESVQNIRLSQPPLSIPPFYHQPDEREINLADLVVQNLIDLSKSAKPGDIAPTGPLRKAMGVKLAHQGPLCLPDLAKLMDPAKTKMATDSDESEMQNEQTVETEAEPMETS